MCSVQWTLLLSVNFSNRIEHSGGKFYFYIFVNSLLLCLGNKKKIIHLKEKTTFNKYVSEIPIEISMFNTISHKINIKRTCLHDT